MRQRSLFAAAATLVLAAAAGQPSHAPRPVDHAVAKRTLTATIVGPTSVYSGACNTWYVSVSGGTPPYSFDWNGFAYSVLDSTGQSVMGGFYGFGARPIGVIVSDANGESTYAVSGVMVRSGGGGSPCA